MFLRLREPVNALTHGAGAVGSAAGLVWMLFRWHRAPNGPLLASALVFGASLLALYSASAFYHGARVPEKTRQLLRKIDHAMIYILIAGTYTPVCLLALPAPLGPRLLIAVWCLAAAGILLKLAWPGAPRFVYTGFYLIFGWLAVFFLGPLRQSLSGPAFFLLLSGGLFYTAGSLLYALKPGFLRLGPFGFHEIFHLFILAGSLSHFFMVDRYLLALS